MKLKGQSTSLNYVRQKREAGRIDRENLGLARRMIQQKPLEQLTKQLLDRDYLRQTQYGRKLTSQNSSINIDKRVLRKRSNRQRFATSVFLNRPSCDEPCSRLTRAGVPKLPLPSQTGGQNTHNHSSRSPKAFEGAANISAGEIVHQGRTSKNPY